MKKQINFNVEGLEQHYANRIAQLELQLAREVAAKNAVVEYAEELEAVIEATPTEE